MKRLSMVALFSVIAAMAGGGYWYLQKSAVQGADKGATEVAAAKNAKAGKDAKGKGKGRSGPIVVRAISVKRQAMPVVIDAVGSV